MEFKTFEYWSMLIYFSFMYWGLHYIVRNLVPEPKISIKSKERNQEISKQEYWYYYIEFGSVLHAYSSIALGGYSIWKDGSRAGDHTTDLEYLIMMNSCAYFIYDTVVEAYIGILDIIYLIHHLCAICPIIAALYLDYGGSLIAALCFWSEMSNPCYLRRCSYKRKGLEKTTA